MPTLPLVRTFFSHHALCLPWCVDLFGVLGSVKAGETFKGTVTLQNPSVAAPAVFIGNNTCPTTGAYTEMYEFTGATVTFQLAGPMGTVLYVEATEHSRSLQTTSLSCSAVHLRAL